MALDYSNTPVILNGVSTEELVGENVATPVQYTLKDWLKNIRDFLESGPIPITTDIGDTVEFAHEVKIDLAVDTTHTFNLTSPTLITNAKTGQLRHVVVSSNVPLIIKIQSVDSTPTTTDRVIVFTTSSHTTYQWHPELADEITETSDGTNVRFQIEVKNNGNRPGSGADGDNEIHCTFWWTEV